MTKNFVQISFKKADIGLSKVIFFKYMFFGRGYSHISPDEVKSIIDSKKDNFEIVDVRKRNAFNQGHIRSALSAPFNDLILSRSIELDKDKEIIITCYGGGMSRVASSILAERGFTKVYNMDGGMYAWGYETEKTNQEFTTRHFLMGR